MRFSDFQFLRFHIFRFPDFEILRFQFRFSGFHSLDPSVCVGESGCSGRPLLPRPKEHLAFVCHQAVGNHSLESSVCVIAGGVPKANLDVLGGQLLPRPKEHLAFVYRQAVESHQAISKYLSPLPPKVVFIPPSISNLRI